MTKGAIMNIVYLLCAAIAVSATLNCVMYESWIDIVVALVAIVACYWCGCVNFKEEES